MMCTVHRFLAAAAVVACALTIGACGNDDAEPQATLPGPSSTTITPGQPEAPNLPSLDGYLISATETEVILKTADGDQKFAVAERDGRRFVKQAIEIPPPALE